MRKFPASSLTLVAVSIPSMMLIGSRVPAVKGVWSERASLSFKREVHGGTKAREDGDADGSVHLTLRPRSVF